MLRTKRLNYVVVSVLVYSLVFAYGFMPAAKAASLDSAKLTLSDSEPSVSATSTIVFDLATPLVDNEYIRIAYDSNFGAIPAEANITCPAGTTASTTPGASDFVECTVDAGTFVTSTSTKTIIVKALANPAISDDYSVTISTFQADNDLIEYTEMKVFILQGVTVQAHVPATLTFAVGGLGPYSAKSDVNGEAIYATSSATGINFGSLVSGNKRTMAQSLAVSTNASGGYIVTVEQDSELVNGVGATINSFNNAPDGMGSSTVGLETGWAAPLNDINRDYTYGHMGLTSDDEDLTGASYMDFWNGGGAANYGGLTNGIPLVVMEHGDVALNTVQNVGLAAVAFSIQISDLQEAGDYENHLTYICTPTY